MNVKKLISSVSALAIAASAFAGLAVTASAALTSDLEIPGYIFKANYNFVNNADGLLPTSGDARFRDGYGLYNFGGGTRQGSVTLPDGVSLAEDDIVVVDGYNSQTHAYSVTISGTTANATLGTSTGYLVFDAGSDLGTLTFSMGRANVIRAISIYEKDTSVATADYTIKYQDVYGTPIKADVTGNGVVGTTVPVDTSDIVENGQKYLYVSDDSASNAIVEDGSTVVTITYTAAAAYSYTVKADQGDNTIASGSAFEGDNVKVAYPKYINVDGTLYERGATNKEYNHTFALDENNKEVTLAYTATEISNVVFLTEGEDITGLTVSNAANTKIRSSRSSAAYAAEDTTITTLPAGKYVINAVVYAGSSGGANLPFTLGANEFAFETTDNSNWVDFTTDEFTITEDTDLVMKAGGSNSAALDLIYVVKTGDAPAPVSYTVTFVDEYAAEDTAVTANADNEYKVSAPEAAGAEGYDFIGWFDTDDNEFDPTAAVAADATYTAKYLKTTEKAAEVATPFTTEDGAEAVAVYGGITPNGYTISNIRWIPKVNGEAASFTGTNTFEGSISGSSEITYGLIITIETAGITADSVTAELAYDVE